MSELTFKDIINQVKCEVVSSIIFTEADLAKAKACIQTVAEPDILVKDPTSKILEQIEKDTLSKTGCIPAATEKVKEIIAIETAKVPTSIKASIVKNKVEELIDNLDIIKIYNKERVDFFNLIVDITEPIASQYVYWEDEVEIIVAQLDTLIQTLPSKLSAVYASEDLYFYTGLVSRIADYINIYYIITNSGSTQVTGDNINSYKIKLTNLTTANIIKINSIEEFLTETAANANFSKLGYIDDYFGQLSFTKASVSQNITTKLPTLNEWIRLLKKLAYAYGEKQNFKNEALVAQSQILNLFDSLNTTQANLLTLAYDISELFSKLSGQISIGLKTKIIPIAGSPDIEIFNLKLVPRIIDGDFVITKLPTVKPDGTAEFNETIIPIKNSPYLTSPIFDNIYTISKFKKDEVDSNIDYVEDPDSYLDFNNLPRRRSRSDYSKIPGLLYNGYFKSGIVYPGLYNKLSNPIKNFFTLAERGLSLSRSQIDPSLINTPDSATITEKIDAAGNESAENKRTYYISNMETYSKFYEDLGKNMTERINNERTHVYPSIINGTVNEIKLLARREVATLFKKIVNSYIKFSKPFTNTVNNNSQYSQGAFTYDKDTSLSTIYQLYLASNSVTINKINQCKIELAKLEIIIKENSLDPTVLTDKILAIPCFKAAAAAIKKPAENCEVPARLKLGKDPFIIRTVDGNDSGLPDITSQCYWKEFTKSLNKVSILPFPDTTAPPPANSGFRYYPINTFIPIPGSGILTLPLPQFYKPLISIPTPLGIIVIILGLPITCKKVVVNTITSVINGNPVTLDIKNDEIKIFPFPIPLPSLYVLYFGPDGRKYLAVSTNPVWLYSDPATNKPLVLGYELDNGPDSRNPLGISVKNPYKGQVIKGALSSPLALVAAAAKAARLAQIAEDIAAGRIPFLDKLSEAEMMLAMLIADGGGEFTRDIVKLQSNINKQLNKIGDIPINAIAALKDRVRENRAEKEDAASNETDLAKKRKDRKAARDANPLTIPQQIDATIADFTSFYDKKMKFGILQFPKDASKHNPGLPEVLKCIEDIIELIALGSAIPLVSTLQEQIITLIAIILETKKVKELLKKHPSFNLNTEQGIKDFKDLLKDFFKNILDYIKGENVDHDTNEDVSEAERAEILKAKAARQETIKKILSATAVALLSIPAINIFDLNKKCCEVKPTELFPGVSPDLAIALALIYELFNALINSLTAESIMQLLGLSQIPNNLASTIIPIIIEELILMIPPIPLPNIAGFLQYITQSVIPMVTSLSVLKSVNPLHPPLVPIVIPLDPLIKALIGLGLAALIEAILKLLLRANKLGSLTITSNTFTVGGGSNSTQTITATTSVDKKLITQVLTTACGKDSTVSLEIVGVAGSNSTIAVDTNGNPILKTVVLTVISKTGKRFSLPKFPLFPIDISEYLYLLTAADLIEVVRELITLVFEDILIPIATIVDVIANIAKALKTFSYNIVEAGILQINLIKLAIMEIDAKIPPGYKMMIPNPLLTNIIKLGALFALEKTEPYLSPVAWLATLSLCAFAPIGTYATVATARLFHPILNSDDLPPWERLTHKNPLFTIFLDELAWKFSMNSTGSLIFSSKSPGIFPGIPPINPAVYPHIL